MDALPFNFSKSQVPSATPFSVQKDVEELVGKLVQSAFYSPQMAEQNRNLILKNIFNTNTLASKEISLFRTAINVYRMRVTNHLLLITKETATEEIAAKGQILKELDELEKRIPLFIEHKVKVDKIFDTLKNTRQQPLLLTTSQWQTTTEPFIDYLKWIYKNKKESFFHETFRELLNDYHVQGLGDLIDDHYNLVQAEWNYLRNRFSAPPAEEDLFQLICLTKTAGEAKKELSQMADRFKALVTLFEALPEKKKRAELQKGIGRLSAIQQELLDKQRAYGSLVKKIEVCVQQLSGEQLRSAEEKHASLTPEMREKERQALVNTRPPIQRGWLGNLWHNTSEEESSITKETLKVFFRTMQLSQHSRSSYQQVEYSRKLTRMETDATYLKKMQVQRNVVRALVPDVVEVRQIGEKRGVNTHYEIIDSFGKSYFLKTFTAEEDQLFWKKKGVPLVEHFASIHEAAASTLASYITSGLTAEGRACSSSVAYPLLQVDRKKTETAFTNGPGHYHKAEEGLYERLNPEQRIDLFVNMLADLVLLNVDTHSGQFVITAEDHLVGLDKGRAYWSLFEKGEESFSTPTDFLEKSPVYKPFVSALKDHPGEIKNLLNHPRVREAFSRISNLALETERPAVKTLLAPLFTFLQGKNKKNEVEESYFEMITNLPKALAKQLEIDLSETVFQSLSSVEIEVRDLEYKTKALLFDPKVHALRIVSPLERGIGSLVAGSVTDLLEASGGFAATNGGFFTWGNERWSPGWMLMKAQQITGLGNTESAFPSATLKVGGELLSDTSDYLPTVGWSGDGQRVIIDEARVTWQAEIAGGPPIPLTRITPLSHLEKKFTLYIDDGKESFALIIENEQVIALSANGQVDEKLSNGYALRDVNPETIRRIKELKPGDRLSARYRLEVKNSDAVKEDQLAQMDYMVAGGGILVADGKVDSRFCEFSNPRMKMTRMGFCVLPDGKFGLVASVGEMTMKEFAEMIQREFSCREAISLDGGGSTTLATRGPLGKSVHGSNIVVSDALVVMGKQNLLSNHLNAREASIFVSLAKGHFDPLRTQLDQDPSRIHTTNQHKQGLLQAYLQQKGTSPINEEIIGFLFSKMTAEDVLHQDQFDETVVHTALRMNHQALADKLLESNEGLLLSVLEAKGLYGQTILDLVSLSDKQRYLEKALSLTERALGYENSYVQILAIAKLIEKGLPVEKALLAAEKALSAIEEAFDNRKWDVCYSAIELFDRFITNGLSAEKALPVVEKALESEDWSVRLSAVELLNKLVEKGMPVEKALPALEKVLENKTWLLHDAAIKLFSTLAEKELSVEKALPAVEKALEEKEWLVRYFAIKLLHKLVEKRLPIENLLPIVEKVLEDKISSVRNSAIKLFSSLMEKGFSVETALPVLEKVFESERWNIRDLDDDEEWSMRSSAIELLYEFIDRGLPIEKALPMVERVLNNRSLNVREFAIKLLYKLIDKRPLVEKALPLAEKALEDDFGIVRNLAVEIFNKFIEQGFSLEKVFPIVEKMLEDDLGIVRDSAVKLFNKFIEKGFPLERMLPVVEKALNDDWNVCGSAIELFNHLIDKGLSVEKSLPVVKKALPLLEMMIRNKIEKHEEVWKFIEKMRMQGQIGVVDYTNLWRVWWVNLAFPFRR